MKIWAKTISGEKITGNVIYEYDRIENLEDFVFALQNICEQMDIPTPIATKVNFNHFTMFNNTRFKPRDFVETVPFDTLDIESVADDKKTKNQK